MTETEARAALSAFVAVGELEVWIAGQPWKEAPGGWAVVGERHPPQRSGTAPLPWLRSLRPGRNDPNRRRSLALGRGDADATGDGLQPENSAFERHRDHPTTRRRFPGLLRDPGFHISEADEGAQRGAGFGFRHGVGLTTVGSCRPHRIVIHPEFRRASVFRAATRARLGARMWKLCFAILAGISCSQASLAQEVVIQLPASQIPTPEEWPECGNTELEGQVANAIINGLTGALDTKIGMPLTSTTVRAFGGSGDTLARLGLHNGKAACQTVCIIASPNARFRTFMSNIPGRPDNGWTNPATASTPQIANGVWEWGGSVNSSAVQQGNAVLFCTTAKNWAHKNSREFRLKAE